MHFGRWVLIVLVASVVSSFSDWLFMGVLFHDKYKAAPELWRFPPGSNERTAVIYSQLIGVLSCAAVASLFAYLYMQGNALTVRESLGAALIVWLAGPVVILAQMVLWTKLHPLIGASHSLGWLVRFAVTGLSAVWLA